MPLPARTYVYVSQASDGDIGIWRLDRRNGRLAPLARQPAGTMVMPMAASADGRHLYAVVRAEPFAVLTFAIDPATGELTRTSEAPLPASMAYACLDGTGRWLLTASYGSSKVAVSPIGPDGSVRAAATQILNTAQHAHAVVTDRSNRFAYVATLGADCVMQFAFDAGTGRLVALDPPSVATGKGDGPRHLVTLPDNRFLYVLGELTGRIIQYAIDPARGTLAEVARIASVPREAGLIPGLARGSGRPHPDAGRMTWCADIAITPDGRHLYTSERTSSRISQLRIDASTGTPRLVTTVPTATQPRGIRIDGLGQYLIATGERSDTVRIYRIDAETGALTEGTRYACGRGANWVEIVDCD